MPAYTLRPHFTALTMDAKLLSINRMSDASFAIDVPASGARPAWLVSIVTALLYGRLEHIHYRAVKPLASTCVATGPPSFIAKPTSARRSAGASLVPSPVTATTSFGLFCSPVFARRRFTEV